MKKNFFSFTFATESTFQFFFPDVQTYNIYEDFIYFRNSNQQIEVNYIYENQKLMRLTRWQT